MQKLKQLVKASLAKEGIALAAGGAALLIYSIVGQLTGRMGSWGASPYLFPAGAATLLLALGLRLVWLAARHPAFMQPGSYDLVVDELADEDYSGQEAELLREVSLLSDDPPQEGQGDADPTDLEKAAPSMLSGDSLRVALTLVLTVLYCILMPYLGFLPTTMLYLFALLITLGEKNLMAALALAVITASAIYLIFGVALGVMLP